MKALRVIGFVIIIIVVVVIAGIYIVIKNFDPNHYKKQIAQQLGSALQTDVEIGKIDFNLGFTTGLMLNVQDVMLANKGKLAGMGITVEEVQLAVGLKEFILQRKLIVEAMNLREPILHLDAKMRAEKEQVQKNNFAHTSLNRKHAESETFIEKLQVKSIRIDDGEIHVVADNKNFVKDVEIKDIDLVIENLILDSNTRTTVDPFQFRVKGDVFGIQEAVVIQGIGRIDGDMKQLRLDDVIIKSDLSRLPLNELRETFPAWEKMGIQDLQGIIEMTIMQAIIGPEGVPVLTSRGYLKDWRVVISNVPTVISNLNVHFEYSDHNLDILDSGFAIADGKVGFHGRLEDILKTQVYSLEINASDIDLSPFGDQFYADIGLSGDFQAKGSLRGAGFSLPDIIQYLKGEAEVSVEDGKLTNFNVLNFIIKRISIFPDLAQRFEQELPEEYKETMRVNQTAFEEIKAKLDFSRGAITYNAQLIADTAKLDAQGTLDWKKNFLFNGNFILPSPLTQSLVKEVEQFSSLMDRQSGEVIIPLEKYNGPITSFRPFPDIAYLSKNLVVSKVKDEVRGLLENAVGIKRPDTGTPQNPGSQKQPEEESSPEKDIVDTIFDSLF